MQSESIALLTKAVVKVQSQLHGVAKDAENPYFKSKYATLDACWDAVRPLLAENGLAVIQTTETVENGAVLVTRLFHESGEWVRGDCPLNPVKNDPQGLGSAQTYARRYGLQAIIGITTGDDDDANHASTAPEGKKAASKAPVSPAKARVAKEALNDLTVLETSQMRDAYKLLIDKPYNYDPTELVERCLPAILSDFSEVESTTYGQVMDALAKLKLEHDREVAKGKD